MWDWILNVLDWWFYEESGVAVPGCIIVVAYICMTGAIMLAYMALHAVTQFIRRVESTFFGLKWERAVSGVFIGVFLGAISCLIMPIIAVGAPLVGMVFGSRFIVDWNRKKSDVRGSTKAAEQESASREEREEITEMLGEFDDKRMLQKTVRLFPCGNGYWPHVTQAIGVVLEGVVEVEKPVRDLDW